MNHIKVVQFGEGNFLRAFVDLYFETLNKNQLGSYQITIIKPIPFGSLEAFTQQNNKYHVVLRGYQSGRVLEDVYRINAVKKVIDPFIDQEAFYQTARDPEVKIIISNTTEAGITFNKDNQIDNFSKLTFPGKLTLWLYARFKEGLPGVYLLPVELIDDNADTLAKCVKAYINLWNLGQEFAKWNDKENYYCNTLVDRIVSGFPKDEETKKHIFNLIGEEDQLVALAEPYGLWAIEEKGQIKSLLPEGHHNIEVIFAEDITYYKKRKVRVLNGSHTNLVPLSLWKGKETVADVMNDEELSRFVSETLTNEIIPFVSDDIKATTLFAEAVKERFLNPFLHHQLTSIALNSVSKWKARCLPSFKDYYETHGKIPPHLTKGLAYLIKLYQAIKRIEGKYLVQLHNRVIEMKDEPRFLEYFMKGKTVIDFLADTSIWGEDLTKFVNLPETIQKHLQ